MKLSRPMEDALLLANRSSTASLGDFAKFRKATWRALMNRGLVEYAERSLKYVATQLGRVTAVGIRADRINRGELPRG